MRRGPKPVKPKEAKPPGGRKSPKNDARVLDLEKRLAEALGKLEARDRELVEAREQQTATSEILRAMSSSPTARQPGLDAVAENAARVCGASDAIIRRVDGDTLAPAAHFGSIPMSTALVARPLTRDSTIGRAVLERRTIHLHDLPNP